MKRAVLAGLVMLAACQAGAGDDYPPRPGGGVPVIVGGGGGGGTGGDAGVRDGGDGDAGIPVEGRVCVITDLRKLTTCSPTGAKGLLVSLGSEPALTIDSDDGHFTFVAPLGDPVWHVSSATADRIVASAMRYGTDNTIPVISTQDYATVRGLVGATLPVDQQASVVVRVVHVVSPVADVGATTTLGQNNSIFYDGNPALQNDWGTTRTGVAGVVWLPGVSLIPSAGTVTLTVQGSSTPAQVPVVQDNTITFVTQDIP